MPELPEVETVRRGLEPVLTGHRILRAEVRRPDLRWPFPERMAERLTGARVERLRRRSKYILADLDTGETLLIHLGMSGRVLVEGDPTAPFHHVAGHIPAHDHVVLETDRGAVVTYNDARRFGAMDLMPTGREDAHRLLRGLGPEPLGNAFNEAYLVAALRGRAMPIKAALLDQRLVAGLGNIYVCEVLYRTGISPLRKAGRLSASRAVTLVPAIRAVLEEAITAGGSSLRDYRRADGALGYFQHAFRVYGREGEACPRSGCDGTVRRVVQAGRSSFYCAACQR
jgi:formamidopyrimidine-DNA glycosylase